MTWLTVEEETVSHTHAVRLLDRMKELEREFGRSRKKVVEKTIKGVRIKYVEQKKNKYHDSELV